jgi:hypothetical protein
MRATLVEWFLLHFDDGDGNAGLEKCERDASAHSASAKYANRFDLTGFDFAVDAGNVAGLAFGEEGVLERLCVRRTHGFRDERQLALHAVGEGHLCCGFNGVDARAGCHGPTRMPRQGCTALVERIGCDLAHINSER